MRRVGIRQLKQNADALVRRVVAGETIEITERGRPVARMVPLPGRSMLDQMMADGRATRPRGNLLSIKPQKTLKGVRPLSEVLAEMRSSER